MLAAAVASLAACAGGSSALAPAPKAHATATIPTAEAKSPALFAVAPMVRTAPQTMETGRRTQSAGSTPGFTRIPGGATAVAASPDGTLWVLSTQGLANGDKYIFHYTGGSWVNVSGAASRIAVGPDGSPWVLTHDGGIYHYTGGAFNAIAGGASDISIGTDGSVYAISSQGGNTYGRGIFHYVSGTWTQLPGAGVRIAASADSGTHAGLTPGGFFVLNAQGGIFYYNTGSGFVQISGGASEIAPAKNGGVFVLGVPASANGEPLFYGDLDAATWTGQPGGGVSVSTDGTNVYLAAADGGIYQSTVGYATPTPVPTVAPTPSPFVFMPSRRDFANVAWDGNASPPPSVCASPTGPNVLCFDTTSAEVSPAQSGYSIGTGRWNPSTGNASVAIAADCGYTTTYVYGSSPCVANPREILVLPTGVGSTTITVQGNNNQTGSFPVTVATTALSIAFSNLPNTQAYELDVYPHGSTSSMLLQTGGNVTNAASNPTCWMYNVPIPLGVAVDITVRAYDGAHFTASSTLANQTLQAGTTNSLSMSVSPTTQ